MLSIVVSIESFQFQCNVWEVLSICWWFLKAQINYLATSPLLFFSGNWLFALSCPEERVSCSYRSVGPRTFSSALDKKASIFLRANLATFLRFYFWAKMHFYPKSGVSDFYQNLPPGAKGDEKMAFLKAFLTEKCLRMLLKIWAN